MPEIFFDRLNIKERFNEKEIPNRYYDRLYVVIANGGILANKQDSTIDPDKINLIRQHIPILSLLGAAVYTFMMHSVVNIGFATIKCSELKTIQFKNKLYESLNILDEFLNQVDNPIISCGGGKDSTAIAILTHQINPDIPILCANPPNPLPDRDEHIKNLKSYLGSDWHDLHYNWDVDKVLNKEINYPKNLKVKKLAKWGVDNKIDGVIMGLRNSENNHRKYNFAVRGHIYGHPHGKRCQPIATWSAEETLCLSLLFDTPINPVYTKMSGITNLDYLHDGTWWSHSLIDNSEWIRRYYPDFYKLHVKSQGINSVIKEIIL